MYKWIAPMDAIVCETIPRIQLNEKQGIYNSLLTLEEVKKLINAFINKGYSLNLQEFTQKHNYDNAVFPSEVMRFEDNHIAYNRGLWAEFIVDEFEGPGYLLHYFNWHREDENES